MAGIYIHIPYCRQKCLYCNFFSVATGKYREKFTDVLKKEVMLQKGYLKSELVETIYFGGGTPSLFAPFEISAIISEIKEYNRVSPRAEITLEANPDDLSLEKCEKYMEAGVNRLSIGIQSFFDDDLEYLNRIHNGERAKASVKEAKSAGFNNISIDLIYGIPGLTEEKWNNNISEALDLDIQHISAYALTVEPKTPLEILIRKKKMAPVEDELAVSHFLILINKMKEAGFIHYEISNFCRENFYSKHNTSYWKGIPYLGLGPSAHSFDGSSRQWNIVSLGEYCDKILAGETCFEREVLTEDQKHNEYIMVTLRTIWGCDSNYIEKNFGKIHAEAFRNSCKSYISKNLMIENEGVFCLTDQGKLHADGIAASLFLETADST